MEIARTPVKSSNVKSVGYDADKKILAIEFAAGGIYHYEGVTPDAYAELNKAKSVGQHIAANIRSKYKTSLWIPKK